MRQDSFLRWVKKLKSSSPVSKPTINDSDTIGDCSLGRKSSINLSSSIDKDTEGTKNFKRVSRKLHKMSDEDLRMLFSPADKNFVLDCIIDNMPMVNALQQERDDLQQQVSDLAKFNHAREPEFVRDRKKLRDTINDVEHLQRRVASETMLPILGKLGQMQNLVAGPRRNYEERTESIKNELLTGQKDQKDFDELLEQFINMRKEAIRWSWPENIIRGRKINMGEYIPEPLAPTLSNQSPKPPKRQRKRVSFGK